MIVQISEQHNAEPGKNGKKGVGCVEAPQWLISNKYMDKHSEIFYTNLLSSPCCCYDQYIAHYVFN